MCGTVGLFVGCRALTFCPRRLLLAQGGDRDEGDPPASGYHSPLRSWHERASVRTAPRRLVGDPADRFYFSPDLVPVAGHRLVKSLPDLVFRTILIQHLYRYLDFTAKLESLVVNRTVLGIAHGTVGVRLPEAMRFDAYKIYCDEAYHTLFSADLARQVEKKSGIVPVLPEQSFFLRRLAAFQDELPTRYRPLLELVFVVISETLISGTLAEVPDRSDVVSAVRETVADHATDEGRHHAYFAAFLNYLWAQLSATDRLRASLWVPRLMDAFLRPDLLAIREELVGHGLSEEDADTVVADVYSFEAVSAHRSGVARQTLRYFSELDAFETEQAQEKLSAYGFREA